MNIPALDNFHLLSSFLANSKISQESGLLRPSQFIASIQIPVVIKDMLDSDVQDIDNMQKSLMFNIQAIQCPGIGHDMGVLNTNNQLLYYHKERTDADLSMTFFEDANLTVRRFFTGWMRAGFDPKTKLRRFPDKVWSEVIQVHPLLSNKKVSPFGDVFLRCTPYELIDMNYDMTTENTIQKIEVKFKYSVHDVVDASKSQDYNMG